MKAKIEEIISNSLEDLAHHDCVEHAYIDGFLNACYELEMITEKEHMELYNKYTDTDYF